MYSKTIKIIAYVAGLLILLAIQLGAARVVGRFIFREPGYDYTPSLILVILGILLGFIIMPFAWARRTAEQKKRNIKAQQLADEIEKRIPDIISGKDTSPFVLYLRPFALEKSIREWKSETRRFERVFLDGGKINFDYLLQEHLNQLNMLLISIGPSVDEQGAGHVVMSNHGWHERFRHLAERARTIVVVPGMQNGILSEIRWLRVSGLLVNAVFFKPKSYPKADWQKVKEFYENEEDIELPDYTPKQLSFRMYSSGRCHNLLIWNNVYKKEDIRRGKDQLRAILINKPLNDD